MNHKCVFILLCCLSLVCVSHADEDSAAKAFEQLKSLVGDWRGTFEWTGARKSTGSMNAAYYLTGNGSVLVENLIMENVPTMTSVYHLDGADLRMTHYCAAQNQPRLKAERIDLAHGAIDFGFVDITNLRSADAPHVHGLELRVTDSDHVTVTFLFQGNGKESREKVVLKRVDKKSSAKEEDGSYLPAMRATKADPTTALHAE
ncbi:MAG: hypothetical protein WAN04_14805 [Candidatus Udaeobacter sp.]